MLFYIVHVPDFSLFDCASKTQGKEKEDLNESMDKLHIGGSSSEQAGTSSVNFRRKPVIIIVVGMAGTIVQSYLLLFECVFGMFRWVMSPSCEICLFYVSVRR